MESNERANRVFKLVQQIPVGKVMTYGQLAKLAGIISPRTVGQILHRNKRPEIYPCHRVVFADGKLSPAFAFGGMNEQKLLLESEGVKFSKGKVDLKQSRFELEQIS